MNGSVLQHINNMEKQVAAAYDSNETMRCGIRMCYNELCQDDPDLEIARRRLYECYPGGKDALRLAVHGRSRR